MGKILITAPNKNVGGVHHFVTNVIKYLNEDTFIFKRGRLFVGQKRNPLNLILSPINFIFSIIRSKPDRIIIDTSLSQSNLLRDGLLVFISKLFCKKTLLVIHGFRKSALKHRFILKQGYFRADSIIVLANEFKESLKSAGYKKKIYIQYNPVSKHILQTKISNRDLSKLDDILFISRIEKAKGIYILLDAFKVLKENHSNLKLHIAGDGTELGRVKNYIQNNNIEDIYTYGYIKGEEKLELLQKTDLFLFPTTYNEGLPISVIESMAIGQAIITRPIGGLVDLYGQCEFGVMLESLDALDYVKAFEELVRDKEKLIEIRRNNIQFAKTNFTPEVIANKILDILNNIE